MNSKDYWERRMAELEALTDRRCRLTASEVAKLYDSALERMTGRIQKIFRRFAEGYSLTPAEAKELLSAAETREARQVLRDTFDACTDAAEREKLRARLDAPAYAYRISRLEALRDQVYADAVAIGAEEVRYDEARLTDVYQQSYYRTAFALSQEQGENVPFSKLTDRQAAAALNAYWSPGTAAVAKNYSQRVWGNTELLAQEVQNTVTRGIMTGERYEDIERELEASMGGVSWGKQVQPDGSVRSVLSGRGAKYRAARLVRTEGNYLSGQGTMESFRDAGIERYIFRALLETRTCRTCGELDGKDFPVSEQQPGTNMHPMHPQCRCFTVPYLDKETLAKSTRAAQLGADQWGEVPQDMTYQEWYGKYVEGKKSVAKAAESTAKATPKAERTPQIAPQDVTSEYLSAATPGVGTLEIDVGIDAKENAEDIRIARWLNNTFGGDIRVVKPTDAYKQGTPDYIWGGKKWELKSPTSKNAIDKRMQKAGHQLGEEGGGMVIDISGANSMTTQEAVEFITEKLPKRAKGSTDLLIVKDEKLVKAIRYEKKQPSLPQP